MAWLDELRSLFREAVKSTVEPEVGVIFSSGVDSALVAYVASRFSKVTAYNVGLKGSEDMEYAKRMESEAPFRIEYVELSVKDVESVIREVLSVWQNPNPVDVGVAVPMYCASKAASEDGLKVVLCGQGGDELFGGYWRYLEALASDGPEEVEALMERDWENAYEDNLDRDMAVNRANGVELRFPFLHEPFSRYVRDMPLELKIREGAEDVYCDVIDGRRYARKYALKKLALSEGLPAYIVNRRKKAAQYGSASQKALDRLARNQGYKKKAAEAGRKDYLQMYLEDVLESV